MCLWYVWWLRKVILCKSNCKLNFCKYSNMGRGPQMWNLALLPFSSHWLLLFFHGSTDPNGPWHPLCWGFMITSVRHTTLSRTPLDEWSAQCTDLYLTTQHSQESHQLCPPQDLNPQSQQASNHRPTPYTVRLLGSAGCNYMDRFLTASLSAILAAKTVMKSKTFWTKW